MGYGLKSEVEKYHKEHYDGDHLDAYSAKEHYGMERLPIKKSGLSTLVLGHRSPAAAARPWQCFGECSSNVRKQSRVWCLINYFAMYARTQLWGFMSDCQAMPGKSGEKS